MTLFSILESVEDVRKGGYLADFNGYLEDYLEIMDSNEKAYEVFKALFEANHDLKIIVNYRTNISKESISNQIIRYKDVFKLKENSIVCPYILYGKEHDVEKAILLTNESYIFAKGLYYCLTEPFNTFQEVNNDLLAMCLDKPELILKVFNRLFTYRTGALQREVDQSYFTSYEDAKAAALQLSFDLKEKAQQELVGKEDANEYITGLIVKWFLIKKYIYVQYMINKDILKNVHEGNVKKQRNQAKIYADEVSFLSFSELWKIATNKQA